MPDKFDAIVVGSGFGGAITACRLAEKGVRVLVLERGRRWTPAEYPRGQGDAWLYSDRRPEKHHGWLDLRAFKNMVVAQAAGVGGGSLAYSSVAVEAHPSIFAKGWVPEITYQELKPYYDTVSRVMNLQVLPDGQLTQRFKLAREAAERLGHRDRFTKAPLAVSFSPEWTYQLEQPFDRKHSRVFTNAYGRQQGTCVHLGTCDIGCEVQAKNTLDLNYLAIAESRGADVRPLHVVRGVEPLGAGYRVSFDRIENGHAIRGEASAARVLIAAGSLGSTELLLRCRDQHRTLPRVSRRLGLKWSANANVLSMATYDDAERVQQSVGPTISSILDFIDGGANGDRFVIEDDGFPNLLMHSLRLCIADGGMGESGQSMLRQIEAHSRAGRGLRNIMVWLGAGVDAADGELRLKRPWIAPWTTVLDLRWTADQSTRVVEAILAMHRRMTEATGGHLSPNVGGGTFESLLTLHPLGGCNIGATAETGVVDHLGQVFGYPNLFVVDGAIVPTPIGRNPSHTIAALAERIAAHMT